ncbi:MAG TPA: DUF72 domain-containing protein [Verrucomicrobiae bacterium]|nr:DUF72 domain-containing protein [Verrucomicrobiae bacterium]
MQARLFVGTSGWIYKEWAGVFYPKNLKKAGELEHYAKIFDTVEINATFYRLPLENMVQGWYRRSPKDFIFAVKGSRFITHIKRLKIRATAIKRFFDRARLLKEKCGPVLWQLPPNFDVKNLKRLDAFLEKLPKKYRHAVEFRHPSWYETEDAFAVLRKNEVGHVVLSSLRMPMNLTVTTDFTYLRFHGLEGGARHDYTRQELRPLAEFCRKRLKAGESVYAYFNNDLNTRAPLNAETFRKMVSKR